MRARVPTVISLLGLAALSSAQAAGVRDFTRTPANGTTINQAQATELTLSLTDAATRPIQNWVRTAGAIDKTGRVITSFVRSPEAELIQIGQRTRAYTVKTRTRMNLGKITNVTPKPGGALVEATLPAPMADAVSRYLLEIVVERGPYLSIPNVSIIEENGDHVVYLQKAAGQYTPRAIKTGLQGELYTQVVDGLNEGDQVVSIGSFFVDAETKLKSGGMAAMPGMDHGAMAGMDHASMAGMEQMAANAPAPGGAAPALVGTDPAGNATVKAPLPMIHVMFNAPVDPKTATFDVSKSDGTRIDVGEAMPMGANMLMAMPKTPLPAGDYTVKWRATVGGAKPLEGTFAFKVQ